MSPDDLPSYSLVLPVKRLSAAKSRLTGVNSAARVELAFAFAVDTVDAVLRCQRVRSLLVVTDDERVREAVTALGVEVVPDIPGTGLNPAVAYGVHRLAFRMPDAAVAALTADLPALRPRELARALDAASEHRSAFVPDAAGTGTTLLTAREVRWFAPRFGEDSAAAHEAAGATRLDLDRVPSVRTDVDTDDDLRVARAIGFGPRTTSTVAARVRSVRDLPPVPARTD